MINDSMKSDKLIGMIQPKNSKDKIVYQNYMSRLSWKKYKFQRDRGWSLSN